MQVISGGGKFYDYNLDFGCCFGHVVPPPPVDPGPDTASSDEILLQLPGYRTLLVNGSTSGAWSCNVRRRTGRQAGTKRTISNIRRCAAGCLPIGTLRAFLTGTVCLTPP
eukprot:SAG11_NODE_9442_length_911_cov_0.951970_1_plen_110_part_00